MGGYFRGRIESFGYAIKGVFTALRTQANVRVHAAATLAVLGAAWHFDVTRAELALLMLAIGLVWCCELVNTALEFLGDAITREQNPLIGHAKDVAAGAVLVAAAVAVVVGVLVFEPYVF